MVKKMKADNSYETTGHNRFIRLTGLPIIVKLGTLPELTIGVEYREDEKERDRLHKAVTLDNVVVPAIVRALNGEAAKEAANFMRELAPLDENGLAEELWLVLRQHGEHRLAEELTRVTNQMRAFQASQDKCNQD